jgi:hypothetical protein
VNNAKEEKESLCEGTDEWQIQTKDKAFQKKI